MKTVCITTSKGGAGKSTNTTEIATALKVYQKKVLVIDLDQTCGLTNRVGSYFPPEERSANGIMTSFDALAGQCEVTEAIHELPYFDIMLGDERFQMAQATFMNTDDKYLLKDMIDNFIAPLNYDYVFIDHGPQNDIMKDMCYIAADEFFVTTLTSKVERGLAKETIENIHKLQNSRSVKLEGKIEGIILTGTQANRGLSNFAESDIEEYLKDKQLDYPIYKVANSTYISEAPDMQTPCTWSKKSSTPARDIYTIADFIIQEDFFNTLGGDTNE